MPFWVARITMTPRKLKGHVPCPFADHPPRARATSTRAAAPPAPTPHPTSAARCLARDMRAISTVSMPMARAAASSVAVVAAALLLRSASAAPIESTAQLYDAIAAGDTGGRVGFLSDANYQV